MNFLKSVPVVIMALLISCAGAAVPGDGPGSDPSPAPMLTPAPTPDIEATITARVQATIAANPTGTPIPTSLPRSTATPEPTPTTTPEPTLGPSPYQILSETLMDKRFTAARSWDAFSLTTDLDIDRTGEFLFPYGNCNAVITDQNRRELLTTISHPIGCWAGNVGRNTETFSVPFDEWVISWWTGHEALASPSNFIVRLHSVEGDQSQLIANFIGGSNEFTVIRGKGDYYLEISTTQLYSIMILAPK
jgi:hypothetical protein